MVHTLHRRRAQPHPPSQCQCVQCIEHINFVTHFHLHASSSQHQHIAIIFATHSTCIAHGMALKNTLLQHRWNFHSHSARHHLGIFTILFSIHILLHLYNCTAIHLQCVRMQWESPITWKKNILIIPFCLPVPDRCDELVAWLDTDTSLIDPSHFNVSVDDVLPELLLSAMLFVEADDCRSDDDHCCDDDRDNNSLSWRNLCECSRICEFVVGGCCWPDESEVECNTENEK